MVDLRIVIAFDKEQGVSGQVIEQGFHMVEEQGQIIFDAGGNHAFADMIVNIALGRVALETFPVAGAELADRILIERKFPRRQNIDGFDGVQGAL